MKEIKTSNKNSKYDEWEIQEALRTIVRANEYSKDAKMMDLIRKEAEKQKKAISGISKTTEKEE